MKAGYKYVFDYLDTDKNKSFNKAELTNAMTMTGMQSSAKGIDSAFNEADKDNDGVVTFDEFLNIVTPK